MNYEKALERRRTAWARSRALARLVIAAAAFAAVGLSQTAPDIGSAWDGLISGAIQTAEIDPALAVEQTGQGRKSTDDFLANFHFDSQTQFIHQNTSFSGLPTQTRVIDGPSVGFGPNGITSPDVYQPSTNHIYTFLNFGTRGYKSKRVNTNFSARYRQDLSNVAPGSPTQRIINTFGSDRRIELLNANIEVNGLGSSRLLKNSSVKVGRQHIYGAEIASLDGGSLTLRQSRFNLTLFGGRRFTYYSDPLQRAIGGANLLVRLTEKTDVEYQGLYYVLGSHVATIRHRITPAVRFVGRFKAVGGSAVDLSGNVMYLPASGKTSLRFGVWQKLSDDGYTYDYTLIASDQDAFNRLPRLYLGVIPKYTQVTFSGRQELIPRVSVGGGLIVRRLNDADQTLNAYAASFEDYRLSTQIYPTRKYDFILEAHQRNVDRGSPLAVRGGSPVGRATGSRGRSARKEEDDDPG